MTGAPPALDKQVPSSTGLDPHVAAALAYLAGPFSGILVLLAEQTNPYVRFHAWQSVIGLGGLGVLVVCLMTLAFMSIVISATAFTMLLYLGWATWIAAGPHPIGSSDEVIFFCRLLSTERLQNWGGCSASRLARLFGGAHLTGRYMQSAR